MAFPSLNVVSRTIQDTSKLDRDLNERMLCLPTLKELTLLLTHTDPYVRLATVNALGPIAKDNPELRAKIIHTLTALLNDTDTDPDPYLRRATVNALLAIAKDNPGVLAQIIPTLTALLNDTNPSVIRVTVNALGTVLIHI